MRDMNEESVDMQTRKSFHSTVAGQYTVWSGYIESIENSFSCQCHGTNTTNIEQYK